MFIKGYKQTEEHKRKIGIANKGKKLGPLSIEHRNKISESCKKFTKKQEQQICNQYFSKEKLNTYDLAKKWNCSSSTIRHIIIRNGYVLRTYVRALNGFGKKCYYNNEFFPSLMERDCYIKLKKLGFKVEHNFEGRFDFLINDKVVIEFHPFNYKNLNTSVDLRGITDEQYYGNRRKLLDEYGYKNLKLIVIKDLKEIENILIVR